MMQENPKNLSKSKARKLQTKPKPFFKKKRKLKQITKLEKLQTGLINE